MHLSTREYENLTEKPFNSQVFWVLSSRYCRYVLYVFGCSSERSMTLDELRDGVQWVAAQTDHPPIEDDDQDVALLVDEALPQLASVGTIDYDPRTQTVHYQPQPTLEEYAHHSMYQELPAEIVNSDLS